MESTNKPAMPQRDLQHNQMQQTWVLDKDKNKIRILQTSTLKTDGMPVMEIADVR